MAMHVLEWCAIRLPSALEVAQYRTKIHACFLVTGDRQNHNREIQHQECCDELDFIFHYSTMMSRFFHRV